MVLRSIYPEPAEIANLAALYHADTRHMAARPWVLLNMVASIDGATAVSGKSSALGDQDDLELFRILRSVADVILVGAGTVRAENYGQPRLSADLVAMRRHAGMTPLPRIAVVTGRLSLEPSMRLFTDEGVPPLIITTREAANESGPSFDGVAELVASDALDGRSIVEALDGHRVVLCEGGPTLNASLVKAGVVDEVNLTMAPLLVGGDSLRVAQGEQTAEPQTLPLSRALVGTQSLFLRYSRQKEE